LTDTLVEKLRFYKLRAKIAVDDLSNALGVMAVWGAQIESGYGPSFTDPRLAELGTRVILPPGVAAEAAADAGASIAEPEAYETYRIGLGVPRGGADFLYGDTFPHEADMDQLGGVDFKKGCYVGQEVVSRVEHRNSARSRVVAIIYDDYAPSSGLPVMAGDKQIGMFGSAAQGRGLALLRLDRVADAIASGTALTAGGIAIRPTKPAWAHFSFPGEPQ
jgi:folate-binding protein YgfZ